MIDQNTRRLLEQIILIQSANNQQLETIERERRRNLKFSRRITEQDATIAHLNDANAALRGELQALNARLAGLVREARITHAQEG